jgi:3'-phosphoadenosine 5'-phosphosulfate sulfotransferase (PAPS reductase)/FAD synthetase
VTFNSPWAKPKKRKKVTKKKAKKKAVKKKLPVVARKKKKKKKRKQASSCGSPTGAPGPVELVAKRRSLVGKASKKALKVKVPAKCSKRRKPAKKMGKVTSAQFWPDCQDRPEQREAWERGRIPNAYPNGPYVPGKQARHGSGSGEVPESRGMPDLRWFVGPEAGRQAGKIVVAFSGGKDSLACLLYMIEGCLSQGLNPSEVIECWHYSVDGRPWFFRSSGARVTNEFDWPCTEDYCRKICACLGIPIYFGWRTGGLMGEVLKGGASDDPLTKLWDRALPGGGPRPVPPMILQMPDGSLRQTGGVAGRLYVRRGFPATTASIMTRWCSGYVKIDVGRSMIANRKDLRGSRTLLVTGERAEESPNRARYATRQYETGHGTESRHVEQWRPIHGWCEIDVWAIIARWEVRPHPCYFLGWGRLSCMTCIFGSDTMWASIKKIQPSRFRRFVSVENKLSREKADLEDMLANMTRSEIKKAAIENALAAIEGQYSAGHLTDKQRKTLTSTAMAQHRSGKLADAYVVSVTGRIPLIRKGKPLTLRTKARWRKAKKVETKRTKKGDGLFEVYDPALPFPQAKPGSRLARIALAHRWNQDPIMSPWRLPAGAFGEASGPT